MLIIKKLVFFILFYLVSNFSQASLLEVLKEGSKNQSSLNHFLKLGGIYFCVNFLRLVINRKPTKLSDKDLMVLYNRLTMISHEQSVEKKTKLKNNLLNSIEDKKLKLQFKDIFRAIEKLEHYPKVIQEDDYKELIEDFKNYLSLETKIFKKSMLFSTKLELILRLFYYSNISKSVKDSYIKHLRDLFGEIVFVEMDEKKEYSVIFFLEDLKRKVEQDVLNKFKQGKIMVKCRPSVKERLRDKISRSLIDSLCSPILCLAFFYIYKGKIEIKKFLSVYLFLTITYMSINLIGLVLILIMEKKFPLSLFLDFEKFFVVESNMDNSFEDRMNMIIREKALYIMFNILFLLIIVLYFPYHIKFLNSGVEILQDFFNSDNFGRMPWSNKFLKYIYNIKDNDKEINGIAKFFGFFFLAPMMF